MKPEAERDLAVVSFFTVLAMAALAVWFAYNVGSAHGYLDGWADHSRMYP